MKKLLFILFILTVFIVQLQADDSERTDSLLLQSKQILNEAVDAWDEAAIINARSRFERLLSMDSTSFLCHYYIGYADYRLASYYHGQNDKDKIDKVADNAIKHLKIALELNDGFADGYALLSSMYGEKIAVSPLKSIYYGPKAGSARDKALELESNNPRAFMMNGAGKYYTPKLFGGGSENAKEALLKAEEYFKTYQPKSNLYPDWGERETYAWLGIIAKDNGEYDKAREYYNQALEIDEDYGWVIYSLLPELKKLASESNEQ